MRLLQTTAFMAVLTATQPAFAQEKQVIVLSDTSVVYTMLDLEQANTLRRNVYRLLGRRARRDRDDIRFDFIETTRGRNVLSISARDYLRGGAGHALELTDINPRACSNLTSAFDQLAYTVRISAAEEVHIVVISPLVHTGVPCPSIDPYAPVPSAIDAGSLFENNRISSISFYGVAEEQLHQWDDRFRSEATDNGVEFNIHTLNASSEAVLLRELTL